VAASALKQARLRPVAGIVAAVEGAALLANALAVLFFVIRDGISGPADVASPLGVAVEVLLYLVFGAAMLWIARGLVRGSNGVLTPFALAQVLGLTVSIPLASGAGAAALVGWLLTGVCVLGLVAWVGLLRSRETEEQVPGTGGADQ